MADARVAKTAGLSRRDALSALVQEHPGEQAYYEAYRKYHLSDGLQEHHAAERAQRRVRLVRPTMARQDGVKRSRPDNGGLLRNICWTSTRSRRPSAPGTVRKRPRCRRRQP